MRLRISALLALLLIWACGGHPAADDPGFHSAVNGGQSGAEVTFDGVLLGDPIQSGIHEHMLMQATTGEQVEVDHNTSLAGWAPAHRGDRLTVRGQLYIDPGPRLGVHCTHAKTSRGCPAPGWVEVSGHYYE